SPQDMFNAATAAMDGGQCAQAVQGFSGLEASGRNFSPAIRATIRLRRGLCQARLGEIEQGKAAIQQGLAVLAPLGSDHAIDVRDGRLTLGKLAMSRYDYATAEAEFKGALTVAQAGKRFEPLLFLAQVTMFDADSDALGYIDEALRLLTEAKSNDKEGLGNVRTLRARILVNRGQFRNAYDELGEALKLQGGLSLKVTLADIVTRSDLALAALLNGDKANAQKYLAYTGAGRFEKSPFQSATSMELPLCNGDEGLRPQDRTVVQFRLTDDGSVGDVIPIYTTGGRDAASEFARAVSTWSWMPKDATAIPALFRYATRVELRCSVVGPRPSLTSVLESDYEAWLKTRSLTPFEEGESDARNYPLAKAALERLADRRDDPARIIPLVALGTNSVTPIEERGTLLKEALRIATLTNAPPAARAYLAINALGSDWEADYRAGLRQLLSDPQMANDPHAGGALRLLLARNSYRKAAGTEAPALLTTVASDTRLAPDDPIRIAALLEQASAAARDGQLDAAQTAFADTGLTEQQCALVGLTPALKRTGASGSDFPMEAVRWGFEGWVRTEFDVLANGRTTNQRTVIAYPPFVFNDAAVGIAQDMRFEASYRPSAGTACSGSQQQFQFRLGY
ncbi:MAG: energy transducer TonB, partial [Pseudomonadota bacterium]|nr:energy transducer TonB [Pseudomonadota bacterium]